MSRVTAILTVIIVMGQVRIKLALGLGLELCFRFGFSLGLQSPKQRVTGLHMLWLVTYYLGNWSPRVLQQVLFGVADGDDPFGSSPMF